MFCANIPEHQSSCKSCFENRLFGQKLSLKSLKSQICLVPAAPQKKKSGFNKCYVLAHCAPSPFDEIFESKGFSVGSFFLV